MLTEKRVNTAVDHHELTDTRMPAAEKHFPAEYGVPWAIDADVLNG